MAGLSHKELPYHESVDLKRLDPNPEQFYRLLPRNKLGGLLRSCIYVTVCGAVTS